MAKKQRINLTKNEFEALQHFLDIAYSDYSNTSEGDSHPSCKEIEKLKDKLHQMSLQQRRVRFRNVRN